MQIIPNFDQDGLLPPGDYEVTFEQLRSSVLATGPVGRPSWDSAWRLNLIDSLETMTRQLWQAGVREVFADGSFAEDKDHPNDIDGHFVCTLDDLRTGDLVRRLNQIDPFKGLDVGPSDAKAVSWLSQKTASYVASLPGGIVPARTWPWSGKWNQGSLRIRVGVSFRVPAVEA